MNLIEQIEIEIEELEPKLAPFQSDAGFLD